MVCAGVRLRVYVCVCAYAITAANSDQEVPPLEIREA